MEYNLEGYKSFDEWWKANRERVLEEDNIRRRMTQKQSIADNIDYYIEQAEQDELDRD